ncbi:MAG: protein translocase subunit SecD [Candidatus Endonucleobacter bathymodioli]|uniref:Protein translocase subunit SecD n=1 Tax=Candidatus Endonucleibacter bathymodioli TaxID=539814 RepID=A0AA90NR98_9GAMM|nr:protein translocase subunit SecD [Candidatus Endonucleobacter bathymodioli]
MLNRYSLWKNLFVILVLAWGFIYALPNIYPADPAVQIAGVSASNKITESVVVLLKRVLGKRGIEIKALDQTDSSLLIRLERADQQQLAKSLIKDALGDAYVVALNLAPTTPEWLKAIGASPMKLGLDLSGGVHFLLEVDTDKALVTKMNIANADIRDLLRKERLRYRTMQVRADGARQMAFTDESTLDKAAVLVGKAFTNFVLDKGELNGRYVLAYRYTDEGRKEVEDYVVRQNLTTVRNRVNELGVSEPLVQRQGRKNIIVELPGVQDTAEAKRILGKTANLEFRLEAPSNASRVSTEMFEFRDVRRPSVALEREFILTGEQVSSAQSNFDTQTGQPQVNINLDSSGGGKMNRATRNNIGRSMAVLFIEQKPYTRTEVRIEDGKEVKVKVRDFKEEKKIISLATIQSALGNQFRITGLDAPGEASELALLLRAGSLAAPMYFVEERTVGPSLGAENIAMGINSTLVGLGMVIMFMLVVYRVFGLMANIALACNLMLLIAIMGLFGATMTMPGIAGIVLTLGMAVDANVLVFCRIREEIKSGRAIQRAIHDGYDRAFVSIFDGNITTLLVGVILFAVGTGPVKGFAVTLSIGILTSMFTAVVVTRLLINLVYGGRNVKKLYI